MLTMTDCDRMSAAVIVDPMDVLARLALADACEERGRIGDASWAERHRRAAAVVSAYHAGRVLTLRDDSDRLPWFVWRSVVDARMWDNGVAVSVVPCGEVPVEVAVSPAVYRWVDFNAPRIERVAHNTPPVGEKTAGWLLGKCLAVFWRDGGCTLYCHPDTAANIVAE